MATLPDVIGMKIPTSMHLKYPSPSHHPLNPALLMCPMAWRHAPSFRLWLKRLGAKHQKDGNMEAVHAFNVATIGGVVGQVKMGKWWGIIDHSVGPLWITICNIQELEYESEDNFSISCCMWSCQIAVYLLLQLLLDSSLHKIQVTQQLKSNLGNISLWY